MAPRSAKKLSDAAIATDKELNEIADTFGVFATAETTTMSSWVNATRMAVMQQIRKTRIELQRLDHSLARLEGLANSKFGGSDSTRAFDAEYAALEGWSLTLMANYIALVGLGDHRQQDNRYGRAIDYTRGAIQLAATHQPGRAMIFQRPVLNALQDQSVIYG